MLSKARQLVEGIRMRLLIRRMRSNLELFGYDVSGYSDQELLDMVGLAAKHFARAAQEAGVSLETMAGHITSMAAAFRRLDVTDG